MEMMEFLLKKSANAGRGQQRPVSIDRCDLTPKHDRFYTKTDGFYTKNDGFHIQNDGL